MSSHGITLEDLSQPVTESYLHLSQANLSTDLSNTSIDFTDSSNIPYDTSRLMKLAKNIDNGTNNYNDKGSEQERILQSSESRLNNVSIISPIKESTKNRLRDASPLFSSHSTPLVPKKYHSHDYKCSNEDRILPDISETRHDETTINDMMKGPSTVIGSDQQPRYTISEICSSIRPLLSKELEELKELKDLIESLKKNQIKHTPNYSQKQQRELQKDLFITPVRSNTLSVEHDSSVDEDEEDNLSLTGIQLNPKNEDKNEDKEGDGEESPATTPPRSQEFTYSNTIQFKEEQFADNEDSDFDTSYIPKRISARRKTQEIVEDSNIHNSESEKIKLLEKQIDNLKLESNYLKQENLNLKIHVNDLEIKISEDSQKEDLIDLASDSIELEVPQADVKYQKLQDQINQLKSMNHQLTSKLERSKMNNQELINELSWLRNMHATNVTSKELSTNGKTQNNAYEIKNNTNDAHLSSARIIAQSHEPFDDCSVKTGSHDINSNTELQAQLDIKDTEINKLKLKIKTLQGEIGNKIDLITEDTIEKDFRNYYSKLNLNKIDNLSKTEMSNLVKNLMLSLLISDFDNLPERSLRYGKFLKISIKFLDKLHAIIYKDAGQVQPSYYLKNHHSEDSKLLSLQSCLNGMIDTIDAVYRD